jgi:predicted transcriptional regulator
VVPARIQGELQELVMKAVWRLGSGSVEQVRAELPEVRRGAYTTVQTVMNRMVESGLLRRERHGRQFVYEAALDEVDYVTGTVSTAIADATPEARRLALAQLVGELDDADRSELARLAGEVARHRRGS